MTMKTKKPRPKTIKFEMYPVMLPDDGMTYILRFSRNGGKLKTEGDYIPTCEMGKIDKAIKGTQIKISRTLRKAALKEMNRD